MTNNNDCKHYTKPFYYPDEAAAEWCGMSRHEYAKFKKENPTNDFGVDTHSVMSDYGTFAVPPDKPCFIERLEQICFAIEAGDIPHQRDGGVIVDGEHVARHRRTVKPQDLKAWIEKTFPNEKPSFLFDQLERKELLDAKKLLEENEKLKLEIEDKEKRLNIAREEWKKQKAEIEELKNRATTNTQKTNSGLKTELLVAGLLIQHLAQQEGLYRSSGTINNLQVKNRLLELADEFDIKDQGLNNANERIIKNALKYLEERKK